jgi:hypothetical protein
MACNSFRLLQRSVGPVIAELVVDTEPHHMHLLKVSGAGIVHDRCRRNGEADSLAVRAEVHEVVLELGRPATPDGMFDTGANREAGSSFAE